MLVSRGLYDFRGVQYVDGSFGVGEFDGLNADDRGEPIGWDYSGPNGSGGSLHFPIYAKFITVRKNRPDIYLNLNPPKFEKDGVRK